MMIPKLTHKLHNICNIIGHRCYWVRGEPSSGKHSFLDMLLVGGLPVSLFCGECADHHAEEGGVDILDHLREKAPDLGDLLLADWRTGKVARDDRELHKALCNSGWADAGVAAEISTVLTAVGTAQQEHERPSSSQEPPPMMFLSHSFQGREGVDHGTMNRPRGPAPAQRQPPRFSTTTFVLNALTSTSSRPPSASRSAPPPRKATRAQLLGEGRYPSLLVLPPWVKVASVPKTPIIVCDTVLDNCRFSCDFKVPKAIVFHLLEELGMDCLRLGLEGGGDDNISHLQELAGVGEAGGRSIFDVWDQSNGRTSAVARGIFWLKRDDNVVDTKNTINDRSLRWVQSCHCTIGSSP